MSKVLRVRVFIALIIGIIIYLLVKKKSAVSDMTNLGIIRAVLKAEGVRSDLIPYALAQGMHESANFASNVFKTLNNVFGWKYVGSKNQLAKGSMSPEGNAYGKYATVADSAKDMAAYLKKRVTSFPVGLTVEKYASVLFAAGYYGQNKAGNASTVYGTALKRWLNVITSKNL